MDMINIILVILLIIPFFWIISDIKQGKIKNKFIFPYLVFLIIFWFFIQWFYTDKNNITEIIIIILFSYAFYINNKWWAWDWKYLIIIWLSSIIIWYLKWYENIVMTLIFYTFILISLYILLFIIKNIKNIRDLKIRKVNIINSFFYFNIIFIIWMILNNYLKNNYSFLIIFWIIYLVIPIIDKIKINNVLKISVWAIIFLSFFYFEMMNIWYLYWFIIYNIFWILSWIIEDIMDKIDIKEIKVMEIKQWDILNNESISYIKSKMNIEIYESPLQWKDVFDIIKKFKEINELDKSIKIYKDIRIWIFLYTWFLITIIYEILSNI